MPTFFNRRYMRDGASATEKAIGAVCLLLTAVIVAGFIWYIRQPRTPFFSIRPEDQPAAIPIEIQHARSLLPEQPAPGWRLDTDRIEVAAGADMSRPLGEDATPFVQSGATRLYQGHYLNQQDSRQQLTARILETDSPRSAKKLFETRRGSKAVGEAVGRQGARDPDGGVSFWAGRYYTQVFANGPARDAVLTPTLLARETAARQVAVDVSDVATGPAAGASSTPTPSAPPAEPVASLPTPPSGWSAPTAVSVYDPGNLWEKIDGRAEAYLAYDFRRMRFGTYRRVSPAAAVDCYIYEMGDATKGFGMYQSERPAKPTLVAVGQEGYASPGSLFFYKGKNYVQLMAGDEAALTSDDLLPLAKTIADGLEGSAPAATADDPDWARKLLPTVDLIQGSVEYLPSDVFSLDFLKEVFTARYKTPRGEMTFFIHRAADKAAADKVFQKYVESIGQLGGKVLTNQSDPNGGYAEGDLDGEYDIIFVKGRYFGGANASPNLDEARQRVKAFRDSLVE